MDILCPMKCINRKDWFTIPNIMGYFRLALIPVFIWFYLRAESPSDLVYCGIVLAVSFLTDVFDGYVARKLNQVTELGILLDPVADKFTQFAVILMLLISNPRVLPMFTLFVIKEGFMLVMGLVMMRRGKKLQKSEMLGKVCTGVMEVSFIIMMFFPQLPEWMEAGLFITSSLCMVASLITYIRVYIRMSRKKQS